MLPGKAMCALHDPEVALEGRRNGGRHRAVRVEDEDALALVRFRTLKDIRIAMEAVAKMALGANVLPDVARAVVAAAQCAAATLRTEADIEDKKRKAADGMSDEELNDALRTLLDRARMEQGEAHQ